MLAVLIFAMCPATGSAQSATCLLTGDSIAVGLEKFKPGCTAAARNGATSDEVVAMAPADSGFTQVIVSMGTNDWRTRAPLAANLDALRARYPHARFAWIAPRKGRSETLVALFAASHHDALVRLADLPSRDSTHPSNYADLAGLLP